MYNLGTHCNVAGLIHEAKEVFSMLFWTCIQLGGEQPASLEVCFFFQHLERNVVFKFFFASLMYRFSFFASLMYQSSFGSDFLVW
jgi:hypothetical protein